ncbi:hypothetical protein HaLaN_03708 [Haematococcus lacustris]|uniref:Uncharacterized protein n=1 Tax=Haematococcus lacustris TaxID=44745 RepID=A0A699YEX5_HAELA|nr:hypothetical protein HaLaN_03708 [Haematococcus lacustris]
MAACLPAGPVASAGAARSSPNGGPRCQGGGQGGTATLSCCKHITSKRQPASGSSQPTSRSHPPAPRITGQHPPRQQPVEWGV